MGYFDPIILGVLDAIDHIVVQLMATSVIVELDSIEKGQLRLPAVSLHIFHMLPPIRGPTHSVIVTRMIYKKKERLKQIRGGGEMVPPHL